MSDNPLNLTPFLNERSKSGLTYTRAYAPSSYTFGTLRTLIYGKHLDLRKEDACDKWDVHDTLFKAFHNSKYSIYCDFVYSQSLLKCPAKQCDIALENNERNKSFRDLREYLRISDKPTFAMIHLLETHTPYRGFSDELTTKHPAWNDYQKAIHAMDASLREFVLQLRDEQSRPILFVFYSDHGEAFGEHGKYGHSSDLHEEQIHVPIILDAPTLTNQVITQPVGVHWLNGTLRSLVTSDTKTVSLPTSTQSRTPTVYLRYYQWYGVIQGKWKLLVDSTTETHFLYNLDVDPKEKNNVYTQHPNIVSKLKATLANSSSN